MKKYLFILVAMFAMSTAAFAQKGTSAVGIVGAYDDGNSQFGIGVKYQYFLIDQLRGDFGGDFFFKKDLQTLIDFNANVHYVFPLADAINVYPMAGINFAIASIDIAGVDNTSRLGVNLGGGFDIKISDAVKFIVEAKYIISDNGWSRFGANTGIAFTF